MDSALVFPNVGTDFDWLSDNAVTNHGLLAIHQSEIAVDGIARAERARASHLVAFLAGVHAFAEAVELGAVRTMRFVARCAVEFLTLPQRIFRLFLFVAQRMAFLRKPGDHVRPLSRLRVTPM